MGMNARIEPADERVGRPRDAPRFDCAETREPAGHQRIQQRSDPLPEALRWPRCGLATRTEQQPGLQDVAALETEPRDRLFQFALDPKVVVARARIRPDRRHQHGLARAGGAGGARYLQDQVAVDLRKGVDRTGDAPGGAQRTDEDVAAPLCLPPLL